MTDKDQDKQAEEAAERKKELLNNEAKALSKQGFSREQIAKQLSSKHQMTVADVTAQLDDEDA